jgi:ureidoacrylate peracid hydrolase
MIKEGVANPPKAFNVYQYSLPLDFTPSHTVLAVVDMQNDFIHPQGVLGRQGLLVDGFEGFVQRVGKLVVLCRAKGLPIIATRHIIHQNPQGQAVGGGLWVEMRPFLKTEGFRPGSWGAEIVDGLPIPDYIIDKTRFSGFFETNMECLLRGLKTETIIFSGVATNVCVESTIRDAFFRNFRTIIIEDCISAYTQEAHEASLKTLRFFGTVISFNNLMEVFKNS